MRALYYVAQVDLELATLLSQLPECWDLYHTRCPGGQDEEGFGSGKGRLLENGEEI